MTKIKHIGAKKSRPLTRKKRMIERLVDEQTLRSVNGAFCKVCAHTVCRPCPCCPSYEYIELHFPCMPGMQ
jgi:hypothetical protein